MTAQKPFAIEGIGDAERIALAYAPRYAKPRWTALFLLDSQLGRIALSSREPALAQLKLAWWRDACAGLSEGADHPILQRLAQAWKADVLALTALVDAWEELAAGEAGFSSGAEAVAHARAQAFAAISPTRAGNDCLAAARSWTLTALSHHAPNPEQRRSMLATAEAIGLVRLPRSIRPLAVLAGLARRALSTQGESLIGDRLSPLAAMRLGIFGR